VQVAVRIAARPQTAKHMDVLPQKFHIKAAVKVRRMGRPHVQSRRMGHSTARRLVLQLNDQQSHADDQVGAYQEHRAQDADPDPHDRRGAETDAEAENGRRDEPDADPAS
jgi:hypothetical protein